jgi:tryptophan 2,3-dioxygenase
MDVYKVGAYGSEDVKRICEQFVDLDELFQTWLYTHYQMVRRIIGVDRSIKALDGLPTQVLAGRMTLPLFRKLWDVRAEMTNAWKRDGGYAPGARRPSGSFPAVPEPASSAEASGAPAHSAPAPTPSAALAATAAAAAAPSAPVTATAQALVAAVAQVDPSAIGGAPPQAAPEDPWSRPEPPTSRRMAQLHDEADTAGSPQESSGPQWAQPPKNPEQY